MNESFFGKYSVFCVFGSVVGCVVVPLVAQLVQQQSTECMILSIIVLTLTAAHLKKGSNDGSHSKLLFSREYEKRRYTQLNNNHKKQKQNSNNQKNQLPQQQQQQIDLQNQQKNEHLKVLEMEKRNEEKRLKKQKKREERLKRKEEELKKQKEIEEKSKERRKKYQKENNRQYALNNPFNSNAAQNYEKYYCSDYRTSNQTQRKYRSLSQDEGQAPFYRHSYNTRNNIPRFNNNARRIRINNHYENNGYVTAQVRSTSDALSISCPNNLSASCSSLSSISSSGSTSPPPPTSPNSLRGVGAGISPWNTKPYRHLSDSALKRDLITENVDLGHENELNPSWLRAGGDIKEEPVYDRIQQKFYQNLVKPCNVPTTKNRNNKLSSSEFNSSSLFCSTQDKDGVFTTNVDNNTKGAGEYSLFGSHQFGSSFKSPII